MTWILLIIFGKSFYKKYNLIVALLKKNATIIFNTNTLYDY